MSNQPTAPLILASASPRRRELLKEMGLDFQVVPSAAAELHEGDLTAREVAMVNAFRKAKEVAVRHPEALVIGADTLVCLDTTLFGKPSNLEEAVEMLKSLQGLTHHVVTGMCLLNLGQQKRRVFSEMTEVTFRSLTEDQIRHYLSRINPLDKAGAYAIQDHGELIVDRIEGSYSNVVGLPVEQLGRELLNWRSGS